MSLSRLNKTVSSISWSVIQEWMKEEPNVNRPSFWRAHFQYTGKGESPDYDLDQPAIQVVEESVRKLVMEMLPEDLRETFTANYNAIRSTTPYRRLLLAKASLETK